MADTVEFELVAPTRLLVSEPVEMVVVPGAEGDFGALPGHAPFISQVRPGVIAIYGDGEVTRRIFVAGGFAEVTQERCTVLAEEAVPVEDIDQTQAQDRLTAARAAVDRPEDDDPRAQGQARRELQVAEALVAAASGS